MFPRPVRSARVFLALPTVLLVVAAACSSDGSTTTTSAPTSSTGTATAGEPITVGMILVGAQDDHGWSQAHYEAGRYLEEKLGVELIVVDKVNPLDRPESSVDQVAADMINQGARIVFATSEDMKDGIELAAEQHPDVPMIWSSGDSAWEDGKAYRADLTNLGNTMGRMEYGEMIAGCAAALTTQTGSIGYLGPLVNVQTRRLANAAFLGGRYCWESYRGEDPAIFKFAVTWLGPGPDLPGVDLDPTQVADDFFDGGADVVVSGIDGTETLVRTGQRAAAGEKVWMVPFGFDAACAEAPDVCVGVPYFNWGPAYLRIVDSVQEGTFRAGFEWFGPDWSDLNDSDTSGIGFVKGPGLSAEASRQLDRFIAGLGDGSIDLLVGPINYQDGTPWLTAGQKAADVDLWYSAQLLEGMEGAGSAG